MPAPLLERRCALTAPFHPYRGLAAEAVCFLWHFPSTRLEPDVPDVIRHTALRSSDFPLSAQNAESGRPVRLPTRSLYAMVVRQSERDFGSQTFDLRPQPCFWRSKFAYEAGVADSL